MTLQNVIEFIIVLRLIQPEKDDYGFTKENTQENAILNDR